MLKIFGVSFENVWHGGIRMCCVWHTDADGVPVQQTCIAKLVESGKIQKWQFSLSLINFLSLIQNKP